MERDKIASAFRARLLTLIERSGLSRSAFAERVGIDRSTLSQLLGTDSNRMPRAEAVIAIAEAGQVSCDWLLGRTQDEQRGPELLSGAIEIEGNAASPMDERLLRWHREASGYTVRYVPTTLPDPLKTDRVIAYESVWMEEAGGRNSGFDRAAEQLHYNRHPDTIMEVCSSWQMLRSFARGEGPWQGLKPKARRAQLENMIALVDELYPTFRWSLYDELAHYSAPITVFGSQRAVIYIGELYFVFNTSAHIRVLMSRFDDLVKAAVVGPPSIGDFLRSELGFLDNS
jgi:transcriptional regulator with XRE-family HTH domain